MRITLLGTGTSHGVPVLGCECPTCTSTDPRDFRTRSSAYVYMGESGPGILIDTATEFRLQSLKNRISRVDLALITHCHADHVCGFDDLRRFNELQNQTIPVYGNHDTIVQISRMFSYIFDPRTQVGGGKPRIDLHEVNGEFTAHGVRITPIPLRHGSMPVLGYRIGDFAYITDCSEIPPASLGLLEDLDLLVLGVLRFRPHPTHLNLEAGLELIRRLKPRRCLFTHICHDFLHRELSGILPEGVAPGYDGEQIDLEKERDFF